MYTFTISYHGCVLCVCVAVLRDFSQMRRDANACDKISVFTSVMIMLYLFVDCVVRPGHVRQTYPVTLRE